MFWSTYIWFLIFVILRKNVYSQSVVQPLFFQPYPLQHELLNPIVEDRHWLQYLKEYQRQKYRALRKRLRRCGFPSHQLRFLKRSDDGDLDKIEIILPYGYGNEYFPQNIQENDNDYTSRRPSDIDGTSKNGTSNSSKIIN